MKKDGKIVITPKRQLQGAFNQVGSVKKTTGAKSKKANPPKKTKLEQKKLEINRKQMVMGPLANAWKGLQKPCSSTGSTYGHQGKKILKYFSDQAKQKAAEEVMSDGESPLPKTPLNNEKHEEYIKRLELSLNSVCKVTCYPEEIGVCNGKPLPQPYNSHSAGCEFTYFSINNVSYLSTINEFETNKLSFLKDVEITKIRHVYKNSETLTNEEQKMIQKFHLKFDSRVEIIDQWVNMHGECYYIRYFAVPTRQQEEDSMSDLRVCLCTIDDYQHLFVNTYNNPLLLKSIDYCWTGALFKARKVDILSNFVCELMNHKTFSMYRLLHAALPLKPQNALKIGLKKAMKNPELMSILKKCWGAPPASFATALNWKPFDYWYFAKYSSWPKKGITYGPMNEHLSMPQHGVI